MSDERQAAQGGLLGKARRMADAALKYAQSDEAKAKLAEATKKAVKVGGASLAGSKVLAKQASRAAAQAKGKVEEISTSKWTEQFRSDAQGLWNRSKGFEVRGVPWKESPIIVGLMLVFFFPLGLWLVWKHPTWGRPREATWTAAWAVWAAIILATQDRSPKVRANPEPAREVVSSDVQPVTPIEADLVEPSRREQASTTSIPSKAIESTQRSTEAKGTFPSPGSKASGAEWGFLAGLSEGDFEEHRREGWLVETGNSVSIASRTGQAALFETERWLDVASGEEQKPDRSFEQFCVFVPCPTRAVVQKVRLYTIEVIVDDGPFKGRRGWLKKKGLHFEVDETSGRGASHSPGESTSVISSKGRPDAENDLKDRSGHPQPDDHAKLTAWKAVLQSHRNPPPKLHKDFSRKELEKQNADLRAWAGETVRLYKISPRLRSTALRILRTPSRL